MRRGLIILSLAAIAAVPVIAQIQPIRVQRPVPVAPVTEVQQSSSNAGVIEPWMTPDTAKAAIEKLQARNRELKGQMSVTLSDLQNVRTQLDEITRSGGSLVRAQCASASLSRRTDGGGEENCYASGYVCGDVEGTCKRQCSTSNDCAPGFVCDTGAARCVVPSTGD
jgi:hypothetical protein